MERIIYGPGISLFVFGCGVGFLIGFVLAAFMSRRHVERLLRIWSVAAVWLIALIAVLLAPTIALAQAVTTAPPATVDIGWAYTILTPLLMAVATAAATVITAVAGLAVAWLRKRLQLSEAEAQKVGLEIDEKHRDALQTALTNAAGLALNRLGNDLKGKTIDIGNPAVASAINSVIKSSPEAVAYFGLDRKPDEIAQKIVAKLPQIANTTTPPAPPPTK